MNIKTSQWALCPIPCFEWSAWDDETYDGEGCPVGSGKTEQDAIDDLMWKIEEENEP
jgi:hypothetical protein